MRRHISKRTTATVVLASGTLIVGAVVATAAMARPHASGAKESFLVTYGPHESEVVVANGAFTGGGTDVAGNNSDKFNLGGGSLRINHPDKKSHYHQKLDPTTCFASFTVTGPYTLDHGTGKYAGYTGHGTYRVTGEAIAQRTASGACDQKHRPQVEAAFIRASGTVAK